MWMDIMRIYYLSVILLIASAVAVAREIETPLLEAYKSGDLAKYRKLIDEWHSKSEPISKNDFDKLPDYQKEAYSIFESFFDPAEWSKQLNDSSAKPPDYKYVIIDNTINVYLYDTDSIPALWWHDPVVRPVRTYTLNNFRPRLCLDSIKTLFYFPKYRYMFDAFLKSIPVIDSTRPDYSLDSEYVKRTSFLRPFLVLEGTHLKNRDNLETEPTVSVIALNKSFDAAVITFLMDLCGYKALYLKNNGVWEKSFSYIYLVF